MWTILSSEPRAAAMRGRIVIVRGHGMWSGRRAPGIYKMVDDELLTKRAHADAGGGGAGSEDRGGRSAAERQDDLPRLPLTGPTPGFATPPAGRPPSQRPQGWLATAAVLYPE